MELNLSINGNNEQNCSEIAHENNNNSYVGEREFQERKDCFLTEKIDALQKEIDMIQNGTHQLFLRKCRELDALKCGRLFAAEKWKEYQIQNLEYLFQSELLQAEEDFKADRRAVREKMVNNAIEKKRKLTDEKSMMSIADTADRIMTRTLRKRTSLKDNKDSLNYKRKLNAPHINYSLKDTEISEDLLVIQRAISTLPHGMAATLPSSAGSLHTTSINPSSAATTSNTKLPTAMATTSSRNSNADVYTDKGRLYYHNHSFDKGAELTIESNPDTGRWVGVLVVANPAEIHIRSSDGTKSRFSLTQLRNGKYTILLT